MGGANILITLDGGTAEQREVISSTLVNNYGFGIYRWHEGESDRIEHLRSAILTIMEKQNVVFVNFIDSPFNIQPAPIKPEYCFLISDCVHLLSVNNSFNIVLLDADKYSPSALTGRIIDQCKASKG